MQTGKLLITSPPMHAFPLCSCSPRLICSRQYHLCRIRRFVGSQYQQTVWLGKVSHLDYLLHPGCLLLLSLLSLPGPFTARYSRSNFPDSIHFHFCHSCDHRSPRGRWLHPQVFSRNRLEASNPNCAAEFPVRRADGRKQDIEHERNPDGCGDKRLV